jgi:hypothetical protein
MVVNGESESGEERLKVGDWEGERLFIFIFMRSCSSLALRLAERKSMNRSV